MTTTLARINVRRVIAPKVATARRVAVPIADPGPVVKWAGGKSRLLPEIEARLPGTFRRYFEPFIGGAAAFFQFAPKSAVIADQNRDLVNMYRAVAWNVEGVIFRLRRHRAAHCQSYFYELRERWNDETVTWGTVDRAAAFIYLNKTCFNGLYRVNRKGEFNVPMGRYKDPQIYNPGRLRAAAAALRRAEIHHADYETVTEAASRGDFVYFDPPYDPISDTSNFTSYNKDEFGKDEQRRLANVARRLAARGCLVMLSNNDTPFVRELYKGMKIDQVMCSRAINSNAGSRGEVAEVLIRSY